MIQRVDESALLAEAAWNSGHVQARRLAMLLTGSEAAGLILLDNRATASHLTQGCLNLASSCV